jgi:hypothetical protein
MITFWGDGTDASAPTTVITTPFRRAQATNLPRIAV